MMPRSMNVRSMCLGFVLCLAAVSLGGCGGGSSSESFTPQVDSARQALELALTAWQSGKKPTEVGTLADQNVKVVDSEWAEGKKKLKSFEIVSDAPGGAQSVARQFLVHLVFDGGQQKQATYHVVGKGEMWVFRDEDYSQSQGM
jgi:hypothetical protein